MNLVQNMNDNQLKAILKTEGAVMVIAGAGSGKTRVLTNRIAYLISEKNILENNILAITFTNKAAKEMKERIYALVGETSKYIWINTFHSMCVRILRQHIELLGYNKNFTILDTSEQKSIIKNIVRSLDLSEDAYQPANVLKIISNAKNSLISVKKIREKFCFGFMKKVEEIFRDIFDDEDIIITEETTADDIEDWDSLAYINIIVALKEEFGIDFSMEEVSKYKSVGELVKAIKNKIS